MENFNESKFNVMLYLTVSLLVLMFAMLIVSAIIIIKNT